jgi:DNA (cytosine-5)-methyltransferase 1
MSERSERNCPDKKVFWRSTNPSPDFAKWTRPRAWCPACETDVAAVYTAKPGRRRAMRYGAQYLYRCPSTACRGAVVYPYVLPAAAAIDWTIPGQRIGDRAKPLQPKTVERIAAGLRRYTHPMLVPAGGTWNEQARPVTAPMRARTTRETEAVCVPLVVPLRNNGVARPATTHPLVTVAAGGTREGLVMRNNTARGEAGHKLFGDAKDADVAGGFGH